VGNWSLQSHSLWATGRFENRKLHVDQGRKKGFATPSVGGSNRCGTGICNEGSFHPRVDNCGE
jgi:hypothetical protein